MSKSVIRKHSAKVISFEMSDGDLRHYARIGGRFVYMGRKLLGVIPEMAEPDGLWRESIAVSLARGSNCRSLRELVELVTCFNCGTKPKARVMMREWTSIN
ncbi:hypothetical protein Erwinia_phage_Fougasse_00054 [Erwinia phage Fougasse]|nr:hypothetical protein Erwinia_phage_Farigoule_00001 [Erwinia phage Farigoule]WJN64017.1 hypothetical protein Erwinia_phage_Fougasse_00054 [Erwinia phage Fougasse]WJN64250.1 hypothetical protein Erwinia_phage_Nougat_00054 [Erwinia phage Nougat]